MDRRKYRFIHLKTKYHKMIFFLYLAIKGIIIGKGEWPKYHSAEECKYLTTKTCSVDRLITTAPLAQFNIFYCS